MTHTPDWMWLDADKVVNDALARAPRDAVISIPGAQYKTIVALARHMPTKALAFAARKARGTPAALAPSRSSDAASEALQQPRRARRRACRRQRSGRDGRPASGSS